jgi:hypothetical protein
MLAHARYRVPARISRYAQTPISTSHMSLRGAKRRGNLLFSLNFNISGMYSYLYWGLLRRAKVALLAMTNW